MALLISDKDGGFSVVVFSANHGESEVGCYVVKGTKKSTAIGLKSLSPSISLVLALGLLKPGNQT